MAELQSTTSTAIFRYNHGLVCWNRPIFLLPPIPVRNLLPRCFCWNRRSILLQSFCFSVTTGVCRFFATSHLHDKRDRRLCFLMQPLSVFVSTGVDDCYIHFFTRCYIACFFFRSSFLLHPCFDFAGTGDKFCYIHVLILLEPHPIFATSTHGGVGRRRRWLSFAATVSEFCYYRRCHLLLPEFFLYQRFFATTIASICWNQVFK